MLELGVKLRRERLVVRDDQRRPIELADDIRHRERLSRTGHAEQRLVAIARLDRLQQLRDRLRLVAARLVVRFELKRHRALSLNEQDETTNPIRERTVWDGATVAVAATRS